MFKEKIIKNIKKLAIESAYTIPFILALYYVQENDPNKNLHKADMDVLTAIIFQDIPFQHHQSFISAHSESSQYIIYKRDMSQKKFEQVELKLLKQGWKFRSEYDGVKVYCHGNSNALEFLYPIKPYFKTIYGEEVPITNSSTQWYISYHYMRGGETNCE